MDPATKIQLQQRSQRYFLEFLSKFREQGPDGRPQEVYYYIEQAKHMIREKKRTLFVKLAHVKSFNEEGMSFVALDLHNVIVTKYMMLRDNLNLAVPELLSKIEDDDLQELVQLARRDDELKFVASFYDMPDHTSLRDLRTDILGQLTHITGTVTRVTELKPELLVACWKCNACSREITGVVQQFKVTEPAICPAKGCGNKTNWKLMAHHKTTQWVDWQRIRLQENESEVPTGAMPRSFDVIVRDEMVERCKPGDKVAVTGSLIVVPDVPSMMNPSKLKTSERRSLQTRSDTSYGAAEGVRGLSGLGNRDLTYKLSFFGGFIEQDSTMGRKNQSETENVRSEEKMSLSQREKDRFLQISDHVDSEGRRDCFDVLVKAVAPNIHGCVDVKKGILLMLIGGVPKRTQEGIKLRGDVNVCLLGDPATAKSSMLKWTSKFLPRAVFTSGKSSTAAGLTASVVRDPDMDGDKVIEPGALMLADNGICCIDEFEQMDQKDMVAIHEAMEQQTITLSKAGIQATLNARTSILASVLPKEVYYQPTLPLHKNCILSPPIMSRFDLFFVLQDIHDEANDRRMGQHILNLHRGKMQEAADASRLSELDLQRYIRLARSFKPKLTEEAKSILIRCYKKLREDRTYVRGAAGVTVRQLESLIRLSEAIARVYLDDKIRAEYCKQAYELQVATLRAAGQENVDLEDVAPAPEASAPDSGIAGAPAAPRRMKISYADYEHMGKQLTTYLARQEEKGEEVKESDLISWYIELIEDQIQTEAQLMEQQHKLQLVINRMIDKDRVILIARPSEDPMRPENRVLVKHPNYKVDDDILRPQGRKSQP